MAAAPDWWPPLRWSPSHQTAFLKRRREKRIGRNIGNKRRGECVVNQASEDVIVHPPGGAVYAQLSLLFAASHSTMMERLLLPRLQSASLVVIRGERETSEHQPELGGASSLLPRWPAAYRSTAVASRSACVFHLNMVSGDSGQLSLVASPLRKTLCLPLLTCPYGGFFKSYWHGKNTNAAAEDLNRQRTSPASTSGLTTHPPGLLLLPGPGMENTSRPQPSGMHNRVYLWGGNLHFMHSSSNASFLIFNRCFCDDIWRLL